MSVQDDDFDGYGNRYYARECAAINIHQGHGPSCAWAGGGDCTCGNSSPEPDYPPDSEMEAAGWVKDAQGVWNHLALLCPNRNNNSF